MKEDNVTQRAAMIFFMVIGLFFVTVEWAYVLGYLRNVNGAVAFVTNQMLGFVSDVTGYGIRSIWLFLIIGTSLLSPSKHQEKDRKKEDKQMIWSISMTLSLIFIIAFPKGMITQKGIWYFYTLIIFPVLTVTTAYYLTLLVNMYRKQLKGETPLQDVSCIDDDKDDMAFEFQTDKGLLRIHNPKQGIFIEGGAGAGKCLAKGTHVIMYDGSLKKVEDVQIGDLLMGEDSKSRTVLNLSQGTGLLYKVKQSKSENYIVNENHILSLRKIDYVKKGAISKEGKLLKPRYTNQADYIDIPIKDFIDKSDKFKRCFTGYRAAIDYPFQPINLSPYYLGLWLGDGDKNTQRITNQDEEVLEFLEEYGVEQELIFSKSKKQGQQAYEIRLSLEGGKGHLKGKKRKEAQNPILEQLREYNLIANKHIPLQYLNNSRKVRLEVLAGLIDSDGYMDKNCYYIMQKRYDLSLEIQVLASSLGLRTVLRKRTKGIKKLNFEGTYYEVSISGDTHLIPVKIDRKKVKNYNKNKNSYINTISVEEYGVGEYYGFELDGNHRFLLKDGTVTHNSASLIEPILHQAVKKGYGGVVYDFKGNPPTLTKCVYGTMELMKRQAKAEGKEYEGSGFAFINFVDPMMTVKVNPLGLNYIKSRMYAMEYAGVIMKNLEKAWIEKTDFWAANAISYLSGIIWRLHKLDRNEYDELKAQNRLEDYMPICTLPHAISVCLSNYGTVLNWLAADEEVSKMMQPMIVAHEKEADAQSAGAVASAQLPLVKLYTKEIYWVMNPNLHEDFNLDITNKKDPQILCVANDPAIQESLSPAIGLILSVCMQQMNQQGKQKSIFCIDELPTIFINKLDMLPATARSNKVVTCLSVQTRSQLDRDYNKDNSKIINENLGNQFYGMTNSPERADNISKLFGEYDKVKTSYSKNDSGMSSTDDTRKEKVLPATDIAGQPIGHFSGKIAGGQPPLFSAQLPYFQLEEDFPIPEFSSHKIKPNGKKRDLDRKEMEIFVNQNFTKINDKVDQLLEQYKEKKDGE